MKLLLALAPVLPLVAALPSQGQQPAKLPGLLEFISARQGRQYTRVPRRVMAFYYTWYGTPQRHGRWIHWRNVKPGQHDIASSTNYPALGAYDSHDEKVIDRHIDLAKNCGIDTFICTWWGKGTFSDKALAKVLARAKAKDFKVTIYWEQAPGEGEKQIDRAVADLLYVLKTHATQPAFLTLGGKPVIFMYGRVMGQVPLQAWPKIVTRIEKRHGRGVVLIADGYKDMYAHVLDGIHTYNICGQVRDKTPEQLRDFARSSFAKAVTMARSKGRVSCITVIPGYDDTKVRTPGINARRQGGMTYEVLWDQAIAADPDWVLITSWNEWHEGSEIEPSWEHGDKYIKLTARFAKRFKAKPPSPAAVPKLSAERAAELRRLFKGKTVAVLPDFRHPSVIWLACTGVRVRELTWADLLDGKQFNAADCPVAVWAGGENYTQTVSKTGDVDRAILRYLGEGGLLLVTSTRPLPFCYNEHRKGVQSAAKFGLPIQPTGARPKARDGRRGWETPPPGARLRFRINNEVLAALPAEADWPKAGDLRWRPCILDLDRLVHGDVYLTLATLADEKDNEYGEGIAYIHHKVSPPKGGKAIYVWMRMADVLDPDDLFYALYRLAAEKITQR